MQRNRIDYSHLHHKTIRINYYNFLRKHIILLCFLMGIALYFSDVFIQHVKVFPISNWMFFLNILKELGFALIVAALTSVVLSFSYLNVTFIEPIQELLEKVGDFNQLVGYAKKRGISAIFGRKQGDNKEIEFWKKTVVETINEADEYLLIIARALDTLIPVPIQNYNVGIISNIQNALEQKPNLKIIIILANNFEADSGFRKECDVRAKKEGTNSVDYYSKARTTVKLCLKIAHDLDNYDNITVKLTNMSPPFAMFMTEKKAVIKPYLPFVEGGKSLIFTVETDKSSNKNNSSGISKNHIYESYLRSYKHILDETTQVFDAVEKYQESNIGDPIKITNIQETLMYAEKMFRHGDAFKKSNSKIFEQFD